MDCSALPSLEIGDWVDKLLKPLQGKRFPLSATFELTDRCNLRCVHCYINQPAGSVEHRQAELTTSQVKSVLDKMADAGTLFVTLTGGEVLLRPDFKEIYLHAKQRGMLVTVFTNGTLISEEMADFLAEYRPTAVEVSIYGATEDTCERVTGIKGAFERCRRGIQLLVNRNITLVLKTFVLTINQHETGELESLAGELGARFRSDAIIWPRLDGNPEALRYQLSLEELVEFEQNTAQKIEEWKSLVKKNGHLLRADHVFNCGAGIHSYHVDSQGRMSVCIAVREPMYNLLENSFTEAWELLGKQIRRKRELNTPCRTCKVGNLCDICPGWSQHVHGDEETPVEFLCKLGYLRLEHLEKILL